MKDPNCIFCRIASKEISKELLYESDSVMAFNDINPEAPVHVLIVPKEHMIDMEELIEDKETILEIFAAVKDVAVKKGVSKTGYRLIMNNGEDSGRLLDHLHMHLLGGKNLGPKLIKE